MVLEQAWQLVNKHHHTIIYSKLLHGNPIGLEIVQRAVGIIYTVYELVLDIGGIPIFTS